MKIVALILLLFAFTWAGQLNSAIIPRDQPGLLHQIDGVLQHFKNWTLSPGGIKIIGFSVLLGKAYGYFNDATLIAGSLSTLADPSLRYLFVSSLFSLLVVFTMVDHEVWIPGGASKSVSILSRVMFLLMAVFQAEWLLGCFDRGTVEQMAQFLLYSRFFVCGIPLLELALHMYTSRSS